MKGIVFTEFLDLVDQSFGEETTDRVVGSCPLRSGGAYTAVGTYEPSELHSLVGALSGETGLTPEDLQVTFGRHLFGRFVTGHPQLFAPEDDLFSFLERIDGEIHAEVRKLYPDAELPVLATERVSENVLRLRYRSSRNLPAFCRGLIEGAIGHFTVDGEVTTEDPADNETFHTFLITLKTK